jgi:hypothetical protein
MKVGVLETEPMVWRRFLIPSTVTLHRLHLVLQIVMGWQNYHLYRFKIGEKQYAEPDPDDDFYELPFLSSKTKKLGSAVKQKGDFFIYEYDFGDSWEHQLLLEDIIESDPDKHYPVCLGGENACPREDSGGPHGYAEMLKTSQNPYDEEFESTRTWLGKDFNPRRFDPEHANRILRSMRLR